MVNDESSVVSGEWGRATHRFVSMVVSRQSRVVSGESVRAMLTICVNDRESATVSGEW